MKFSKDNIISLCVFLSGFSCFAQLYYFQPILPNLSQYFGISAANSSLSVSLSTAGMMCGLFVMIFIADRLSRKKLIGSALLLSSFFTTIIAFVPDFTALVALSFAKGFMLSGATSVSMAYIAEEVSPENRSRITGLYIAGNAIGGMCGRFMSSILGEHYSWQIVSLSMGLTCAIFAILFLLFSPSSIHFTPHKIRFSKLLRQNLHLITHKNLVPFYLTGGLILGVFVSLYNYLGFFITKAPFDIPPKYVHYVYLMYIFGVFGSVFTAKLNKKVKTFTLLPLVIILSMAGISLMYIPHFLSLTLGLAIFTFGFFVTHVLCNRIVGEFNPSKRSVTISIYLLTYYLGSSLLGSTTGVLLDSYGWKIFFIVLISLLVLTFIVIRIGITRWSKIKTSKL